MPAQKLPISQDSVYLDLRSMKHLKELKDLVASARYYPAHMNLLIQGYKLVRPGGRNYIHTKYKTYKIGREYKIKADTRQDYDCSYGLNVGTWDWCKKNKPTSNFISIPMPPANYKVLVVHFRVKDVACIPNGTDGKLRLHKGLIVSALRGELLV